MRIPPFDPLHADSFVIQTGDIEFRAKDVDFSHFHEFDLIKSHLNWKKCYAKLEVRHPIIGVEGSAEMKGHYLDLSLDGSNGTFTVNMSMLSIDFK